MTAPEWFTKSYTDVNGESPEAIAEANELWESFDEWEQRVQTLEAEGMTRSDAQAVADVEQIKGRLGL